MQPQAVYAPAGQPVQEEQFHGVRVEDLPKTMRGTFLSRVDSKFEKSKEVYDVNDIARALERLDHAQRDKKKLLWYLGAGLVFAAILVASLSAVVVVTVENSKDTKVQSSNTLVSKKTGHTLKVGSSDYELVNGVMKTATDNATVATKLALTHGVVSSELTDLELVEIKSVVVSKSQSYFVHLEVLGVARVADASSGSMIVFITHMGEVHVKGSEVIIPETNQKLRDFTAALEANAAAAADATRRNYRGGSYVSYKCLPNVCPQDDDLMSFFRR